MTQILNLIVASLLSFLLHEINSKTEAVDRFIEERIGDEASRCGSELLRTLAFEASDFLASSSVTSEKD